jgi:hypothetical protein
MRAIEKIKDEGDKDKKICLQNALREAKLLFEQEKLKYDTEMERKDIDINQQSRKIEHLQD